MLHFIARLQQKSEEERRHIAFLVALISTFIIFGLWLSFFLSSTLTPQQTPDQPLLAGEMSATSSAIGPSPFVTIYDAGQRLFQTVTESVGKVKYYSGQ